MSPPTDTQQGRLIFFAAGRATALPALSEADLECVARGRAALAFESSDERERLIGIHRARLAAAREGLAEACAALAEAQARIDAEGRAVGMQLATLEGY